MKKIDFKKEKKEIYTASAKDITLVEVPRMQFLMIDGEGDPNTALLFKEAVEALYALSYNLKFAIKKGSEQIDYAVMPLEGLWWMDDMSKFNSNNKDEWLWTLMIMQPDFISDAHFNKSCTTVKEKKNPPALVKIKFLTFEEGLAAQLLHLGPYDQEAENIARMHAFIGENGYTMRGKHHEIYLTDARRAAPEKNRTILRQPLKRIFD